MLFTVITPCYNAEKYLTETIRSVLSQTALHDGSCQLQYLIIDGQSSDSTVSIARQDTEGRQDVTIISEPDRGMYDALAKGLQRASGDIVAYLNAGDLYSPSAFSVVRDVLVQHPSISWLTGMQTIYNEHSQIVRAALPYRYRRAWFTSRVYGAYLPYVQQESTFFRRELLEDFSTDMFRGLRYAGDYALWQHFATQTELHIVEAWLAGFRKHAGQLSAEETGNGQPTRYELERRELTSALPWPQYTRLLWDMLCSQLSPALKTRLNRRTLHRFDHTTQRWL